MTTKRKRPLRAAHIHDSTDDLRRRLRLVIPLADDCARLHLAQHLTLRRKLRQLRRAIGRKPKITRSLR